MNLIPILYDNDEIYIINKPAGLSVQGGEHISHSLDVDFAKQTGHKVYLVHRLDKDTCGLMIVAKTPLAANKWTKLISSKEVKKEYVAICCGRLSPDKGKITETLEQHGQKKSAVTYYQVEKEWETTFIQKDEAGNLINEEIIKMSNVRLTLETGRMHQIRIHLGKMNCPIAGDDQHGNFKINKKLKKALKIKQLLLCSQKLYLPLDNQIKVFEVPLPEHMIFQSLEN